MDEVEGTIEATVEDAAALRDTIDAQAREIEELKARLAAAGTSRRNLLKGAGAVAGGLAAIGAVGAAGATGLAAAATPAAAFEAPPTYPGAPSVALFLRANGEPIEGDNTAIGQEKSIECVYYSSGLSNTYNARTGLASGKRQHEPITIRKRIDKSTPLLAKALCNNEVIDAVFKFYRGGTSGKVQQYYTVEIKNGRIASFNELSPDNMAASLTDSDTQPLEEVSFIFQTITWLINDGGIAHTDSWSGKA